MNYVRIKILIAEDEEILCNLLRDILEQQGYEVIQTFNGEEAVAQFFKDTEIQLVILDIMMPKLSGWQVLGEIRQVSQVPVILLTALGDSASEIKGLESGANDYISKPFSYEILCARVKAALRSAGYLNGETLQVGCMEIIEKEHQVLIEGKPIVLNHKEYQLLSYMVHNSKIVLDRDRILAAVWGYDYGGTTRTVDTHIKMLRAKLGKAGNYIKTVRGTGYRFTLE